MNKRPYIVSHDVFITEFLVMAFEIHYILVESLTLLLSARFHVLIKYIKTNVKDMDFDRHFAVVSHHCLNKLFIVYSSVISQKPSSHCNTVVPCWVICLIEHFFKFFAQ